MRLMMMSLLFMSSCPCVYSTKPVVAVPRQTRPSRYERYLEKVFAESDNDQDGRMTLTETYEWVLRLYIRINQDAPIKPPTLAQVQRIVSVMDTDRSQSISKSEFRALAEIFVRRAAVRVAANKAVTLLVAPLMAEACLRKIQTQTWLYDCVVVPYVPIFLVPWVTNPVLGRTALIAVFVSTFGGLVTRRLNLFLDRQIERRERAIEQSSLGSQ
jgi:hypothetical protein